MKDKILEKAEEVMNKKYGNIELTPEKVKEFCKVCIDETLTEVLKKIDKAELLWKVYVIDKSKELTKGALELQKSLLKNPYKALKKAIERDGNDMNEEDRKSLRKALKQDCNTPFKLKERDGKEATK